MLAPTTLFAHSPFDGTWERVLDRPKSPPEPLMFPVNDGSYDAIDLCSCSTR